MINRGNELYRVEYTPYIDIMDFNQEKDLSLKVTSVTSDQNVLSRH